MNFEHLTGKRILGEACPKDYTDWAESILCEGAESENIAILAGIGLDRSPDSDDVETYFNKSIKDLGLILPSVRDGLKGYAKFICEQIILGDIEPETGLKTLETFYSSSDYQAIYSIWDELGEDIWMLRDGDGCIFNTGLTIYNIDLYIVDVAKQFIEILHTDLPDDFFHLSACPVCGYIGKSELERIEKPWMPELIFRLIYQRGATCQAICAKCQHPFPKNMSDYEGRKQYIDSKCSHENWHG